MTRAIVTELIADPAKFSSGLNKAQNQATGFGGKMNAIGTSKGFMAVTQGVGIGVGVGAYNLLSKGISIASDAIGDSIANASDLNEQINKTKAIFGPAAQTVLDFGETSAKSLGISNEASLEAAGNFGNLFNTIGITGKASAGMSTNLVTLASDLASFNNIDPSEALEKLRSGLAGEAEPLRTVGVLINETTVAAKAQELGFRKVNGQFTEGQKVQARYALIMEQTSKAQGDFAKTSGSMANQQRILNAEVADSSAKLGEKFIPIVQKTQRALIELEPAIEGSFDAIGFLTATVTNSRGPMGYLIDQQKANADAAQAAKEKNDALNETLTTQTESAKDLAFGFTTSGIAADDLKAAVTKLDTKTGVLYEDWYELNKSMRSDMRVTKDQIQTDFAGLTDYMKNRLTDKELRNLLNGKGSMGATLLAGLKSKHGDVVEETGTIFTDIMGKMTTPELKNLLTGKGAIGAQLLKDLNSKDPAISAAARKIMANVKDELDTRVDIEVAVHSHPINKNGPGKAMGGPVTARRTYMVGERGPELFVSDQSGTIIPNHELAKGGGIGGGGGWGGGGTPAVVHIHGDVYGIDNLNSRIAEGLRRAGATV